MATLLSDSFGFGDETNLQLVSIITSVKEATLNALTVYKNLARSASSISNFDSAYCIEKITFAMNFVLTLTCPTLHTELH